MVHSLTRTKLGVAVALAVLAGYVDGFGFVYLGGYFVSFMSGNTTRAGVSLAGVNLAAAGTAMLFILAFVLGAAIGTAIASRPGRGAVTLTLIATALAAASVLAGLQATAVTGSILALAMGAANTVLSERGEVSFGVTYMTGALVKIGQHIVFALRGGDRWGWARYLVLWTGMATGATMGGLGHALIGTSALWVASAASVALALVVRPKASRARAAR